MDNDERGLMHIREYAKDIRKKLDGGKLFGVSIDKYPDDIDVIMVSAYVCGFSDGQHQNPFPSWILAGDK